MSGKGVRLQLKVLCGQALTTVSCYFNSDLKIVSPQKDCCLWAGHLYRKYWLLAGLGFLILSRWETSTRLWNKRPLYPLPTSSYFSQSCVPPHWIQHLNTCYFSPCLRLCRSEETSCLITSNWIFLMGTRLTKGCRGVKSIPSPQRESLAFLCIWEMARYHLLPGSLKLQIHHTTFYSWRNTDTVLLSWGGERERD